MIENPMVVDANWRRSEREPEVVGCCEGCGDDIYSGEDIFDFDGDLLHQDSCCCRDYVANVSRRVVAGE